MIWKSRLYKSCVGFPGDPGAGPGTQGCIFLYLCDFVNKCIAPTESVFIADEGGFVSVKIVRPAEVILDVLICANLRSSVDKKVEMPPRLSESLFYSLSFDGVYPAVHTSTEFILLLTLRRSLS